MMGQPTNQQIAGTGMAATASGSVLGAFGAVDKGIASYNQFNYQASIARMQQKIDAANAEMAAETGREENLKRGTAAGIQMGQIKVAQASSNFDVRSGSSAAYRASVAGLNRTGMAMDRSNTAKQIYNWQLQGTEAGAQASLYQMAGSNALVAGGMDATSSLLGGAASVSNEWLQASRGGYAPSYFGSGSGSPIGGDNGGGASSWAPPVPVFGGGIA